MKRFRLCRQAGSPPALILILSWLPGSILGISMGPLILLHDEVADDGPTLVHELVHSRQFWQNGLVVHFLRYWLSRSYRQAMEVEAFQAELRCRAAHEYEACLDAAARALAHRYSLKIAEPGARKLLDITPGQNV